MAAHYIRALLADPMRDRGAVRRAALRGAGPYVQLEAVEGLHEVSDSRTPEAILIEREEQIERDDRNARMTVILRRIPEREALALMLNAGLYGHRRHGPGELVSMGLGATPDEALAIVASARAAVLRLAGDDAEAGL